MTTFYAHTKSDANGQLLNPSKWEPLFSKSCDTLHDQACEKCRNLDTRHGHLNKVAYLAGKFAGEMFPASSKEARTATEWGRLVGWWHDLGKYSEKFQRYLDKNRDTHQAEVDEKVDHATAGAQLAASKAPFGHIIANAIAGHHSGLLDARNTGACLEKRQKKQIEPFDRAPAELLDLAPPKPPEFLAVKPNDFQIAFYQRMIFSCLVDADFLATESFMNPEQTAHRAIPDHSVFKPALNLLEAHINAFGTPESKVDQARNNVYQDCLSKSARPPGIFKLTVPTGGGKTLSSLAFALKHALKHGQRRIIYVIPFTSIIEQNAKVFSDLLEKLGSEIVLEHHSNFSPEKEEQETTRSRLACENWDAPIIVTTAVQFYESLFAAQTSRSRKLHNIANSVVILDEAQSLPVQYLNPCLRVLEQLTKNYSTSAVLCTATQPAIERNDLFTIGLNAATEIISDTETLFSRLDRVRVQYRGTLDDATIANELKAAEQALCIVNTRKHAQVLYQSLPDSDENYHLSTLMCPQNRLHVLERARERLDKKLPVRLISTQLIEAGVDIDFPLVYRSMAGLDSIAQAAGRCNRNGFCDKGQVHVFHSEHVAAETYFREAANIGYEILDLHADDPLSTDSIRAYFEKYYYQQKSKWDAKEILDDFKCVSNPELPLLFQYRSASEKFKLIENQQIPIIIPWDETAKALVEKELRVESIPLHRKLLRSLQRYTVQIYEREFRRNAAQFESLRDGQFHVLICPETHYSERFGLNLDCGSEKTLIC